MLQGVGVNKMQTEMDVKDALANLLAQRDYNFRHTNGYSSSWIDEKIKALRWVLEQGEL